jgi:hypothetical protein
MTADARTALDIAMKIKTDAVAARGADGQTYTMLHLHHDGILWAVLPLVVDDPVTRHQLAAAAVAGSPADEAAIVMDTYVVDPDSHDPRDARTVEQRFAAGDPAVTESLAGAVVRRDGTDGQWAVQYAVVGRRVEWGTPEDHGAARGPMADALRWAFENQDAAPKRFDTPEGLATELGIPLAAYPTMVAPPRNAPCGCGSGRKSKLCCWA